MSELLEQVEDLLVKGLAAEMSAVEFNDPLPDLWREIEQDIAWATAHLSVAEFRQLYDQARLQAYGRVMEILRAKGVPAEV